MRAVGISTILVVLGAGCLDQTGGEVAGGATAALESVAGERRDRAADAGAPEVADEALEAQVMEEGADDHEEDVDVLVAMDEQHDLLEELSAAGIEVDAELSCPRGELGENVVYFDCNTITVLTCKDLSNVVLELEDGTRKRFEGLSGHVNTFEAPGGASVLGAWVKAGNNHGGEGPGYGERFAAPEDSCQPVPEDEGCGGVCQPNEDETAIPEGPPVAEEPAGQEGPSPCPYATADDNPCYG